MELTHPTASWTLEYTDGRASGPRKLEAEGATLFSFAHCRIDKVSDDDLDTRKFHLFRKGGCAVFEGEGDFTQGAAAHLRQTHRIAGNTARLTYDLTWPKNTSLKSGLELGSVVLAGFWQRYFVVTEKNCNAAVDWKEIPKETAAPIVISPLPEIIVLEDAKGRQLEWGLGDDLWRWQAGLNGEFLHATSRLELSSAGNRLTLRRFVSFCDPEAEAAAAKKLASDPRFQPKEEGAPAPEIPVSQPEARSYRFNAYFAWSAPDLIPNFNLAKDAKCPAIHPQNGFARADLEALGEAPKLELDFAKMPMELAAHRNNDSSALPCWESRAFQAGYRKLIRQLADYAHEGVLVLKNMTPGWCNVATHEARRGKLVHWDLPAILDTMAWTRQILGDGWTIIAPQTGIWNELPSLSASGAETGFRN
ncbi:MAG: hypothetical protein MJ202_02830 [Lentisphaeria bacterium]|nr:hypothetical protein [Lentisphaeria bacterium]